jgi:hypothetical protein
MEVFLSLRFHKQKKWRIKPHFAILYLLKIAIYLTNK